MGVGLGVDFGEVDDLFVVFAVVVDWVVVDVAFVVVFAVVIAFVVVVVVGFVIVVLPGVELAAVVVVVVVVVVVGVGIDAVLKHGLNDRGINTMPRGDGVVTGNFCTNVARYVLVFTRILKHFFIIITKRE